MTSKVINSDSGAVHMHIHSFIHSKCVKHLLYTREDIRSFIYTKFIEHPVCARLTVGIVAINKTETIPADMELTSK